MHRFIKSAAAMTLAVPMFAFADDAAPEAPQPPARATVRVAAVPNAPAAPVQFQVRGVPQGADDVVLLQHKEVRKEKVAFLGVSSSPVPPSLRPHLALPKGVGLVVERVEPDSPAMEAGLKEFDVLYKLGDQLLVNTEQLATLVRINNPGDEVTLTIIREGKPLEVKAKLVEREVAIAPQFEPRNMVFPRGQIDLLRELEVPLPEIVGGRAAQSAKIVVADNEHTLTITVKDGARTLLATDKDGTVIYEGPIDTKEQVDELPEEIREKVRRINDQSQMSPAAPTIRQFRFRNANPIGDAN